ncbi:MAG TPA: CoA ester lyase [Alphaproteobacteria bacterium]|nr:CoA ester lyase [Alphaproteobacteria bacterium]
MSFIVGRSGRSVVAAHRGPRDRAPGLWRCWLFVPGADKAAMLGAARSGADVLIQELEDFTPPERRAEARALAPEIFARWRADGVLAAVRVNPLDGDGRADLAAVMRGRPDIVALPKVAEPAQIAALDAEVTQLERVYGIAEGHTRLAPNIETARGVMQTYAIAKASPRVVAVIGSTEDMAADLNAERSPAGDELWYARARLHLECRAAGVVSVDCPYTFADAKAALREARQARRLGYSAKSAVSPAHVAAINRALTPSPTETASALRIVRAFETARAKGKVNVRLGARLVELPVYLNAKRLLERARLLGE